MSPVQIPLSATPFDPAGLANSLAAYADLPQMQAVSDFEHAIAAYAGTKHALALNSGTAAIHLALRAVGVSPGDRVMVSTFTYVATINPVIYLGAIPVFIDSEQATWNMDPALLEEAISDNIKEGRKVSAILVVHAYGMPADMTKINAISAKYNIPVIEDAAEALGSKYGKTKLGALGAIGIFSFNNNKIITTYGGGALVTNDTPVYLKTLRWASQAREDKPFYEHKEVGFSYRMGPLNAIQGISAMTNLGAKIARRRSIYDAYHAKLLTCRELGWVDEPSGSYSNRWLTTILGGEDTIGQLMDACQHEGIETRRLWKPMHEQPVFQAFSAKKNGVSSALFKRGLTLPSSDDLTDENQEKVCALLLKKMVTERG
jgi:dTDP-4-amino-4,6-dideoxygalactose transaminase